MTAFEQKWHDRYMADEVLLDDLLRLVAAGRLSQPAVDGWVQERKAVYGV